MRTLARFLGVCLVGFGALFGLFAVVGYFAGRESIGIVAGLGVTALILIAWGGRLMTGTPRHSKGIDRSSIHTAASRPRELTVIGRCALWFAGLICSLLGVTFGLLGLYLLYVWREQWWYAVACGPAAFFLLVTGPLLREAALWTEDRAATQLAASFVKLIESTNPKN